jgi:hypothetical protein
MASGSSESAADAVAPEQAQFQSLKGSRGILNASIFGNCFDACLLETIATYLADLMDSPLDVTQQHEVLKTLSNNFQP